MEVRWTRSSACFFSTKAERSCSASSISFMPTFYGILLFLHDPLRLQSMFLLLSQTLLFFGPCLPPEHFLLPRPLRSELPLLLEHGSGDCNPLSFLSFFRGQAFRFP